MKSFSVSRYFAMNYFFVIFKLNFLLLQSRIHWAMVVTMFEDEMELIELFESTNYEVSIFSDPLTSMDMTQKIDLWKAILSSAHFVDKQRQSAIRSEYLLNANQFGNRLSVEQAQEFELYSYKPRTIHYGNNEQTRHTLLCEVEIKNAGTKIYYHIFYAYRRNSYFIGEFNTSKNEIILVGLAEPKGVHKPYESQGKLEDSFQEAISTASKLGLRKNSPPSSPSKRLTKLRITEKVRLCGQIFASDFYCEKQIKFVGKIRYIEEYGFPLLISFKSERWQHHNIYEYMFGCVVTENGNERVYRILNSYNFSDEDLAVYVFAYREDDKKQFLDSYITAITVLMPTEPARHPQIEH